MTLDLKQFHRALKSGISLQEAMVSFEITDTEACYLFGLAEKMYGAVTNQYREEFFDGGVVIPGPVAHTRPPAVYSNRSQQEVIDYYLKYEI